MIGPPPPPPSVKAQQGAAGPFTGGAAAQKSPLDAIAPQLVEIVQKIRTVIPMVAQAAPEAMIYMNRSMEALNMAVNAKAGGKNPAQAPPVSPPGPLEPGIGQPGSAGPSEGGIPEAL